MEVTDTAATAQALAVRDSSAIGTARRAAVARAERAGLSETVTGRVALVATELATNLVRHAGGGILVLQGGGERGGVEILSLDRGPGILDVGAALRDGYSTGGTSGGGLGAVHRLADQAEVFSVPGSGTIVLARFAAPGGADPTVPDLVVGGLSVPHAGESVCGDAWAAVRLPEHLAVLVVDGLGHGAPAALAAGESVRVFRERAGVPAVQMVEAMHAALRSTRGAAVGLAEIRPRDRLLTFVGVGNIGGSVVRPG
ncbi:MAG TPA: ATP-binding protein, partial [Gemmatimonadales bacterium]